MKGVGKEVNWSPDLDRIHLHAYRHELFCMTISYNVLSCKITQRLESFNPESYMHSFPLESPSTLSCLFHISLPVTCSSLHGNIRSKSQVSSDHRVCRPLYSFLWALQHLLRSCIIFSRTWSAGKKKRRPKRKRLAQHVECNLHYCFSNTTSPETEGGEWKAFKAWGLQGEKTQMSSPINYLATLWCLWKKSNWEQFHTGIYLVSLTLGILGPYWPVWSIAKRDLRTQFNDST